MSRYDVGIFGWWYNQNYGANITYYALNRAVKKLGYSVVMLWRTGNFSLDDTVPRRFAKKYYNLSDIQIDKKGLKSYNDICNAFILGSDQIWNPYLEKYTGDQFFLSFVDDERVKLAYAQSFGNFTVLPHEFTERYSEYIKRMDKISVREHFGKEICREAFNTEVEQVCDPVFLLETKDYDELIKNADISFPDKYILNFILDPTYEKIEMCRSIRQKKGYESYVNFTDLEQAEEKSREFSGDEVIKLPSVENFIKAFANADYVITDSFHGTCLAIIFNKPFISLANKKRGTKRFESVLKWLGLTERLFFSVPDAITADIKDINYEQINLIIKNGREKALKWIEDGLKPSKIITRQIRSMCMGCGACASICPFDALTIKPDKHGYYKPVLDETKCTICGACSDVCPSVNKYRPENSNKPGLYAFIAKDNDVLRRSSSGGIFEILAKETIKYGGAVVGASWTDSFSVKHIFAETEDEIQFLQKSKYMQSYTGNIFRTIKKYLDDDRIILFSGCPCQVAGLNSYLKKDYYNLFTIDLLCANAPSSLFFKKYLEEKFGDDVEKYSFRHKIPEDGINCTTVFIRLKDGKEIICKGIDEDLWQKAFHSHLMTSIHCEKCEYSKLPRPADITIGDFWGITSKGTNYRTNMGISAVMCNTEKGELLYKSIPESSYRINESVPLEWLGGNGYAVHGNNHASVFRDAFYKYITENSFSEAYLKSRAINKNFSFGNGKAYLDKKLSCEYEEKYWESEKTDNVLKLKTIIPEATKGHFVCFMLSEHLQINKKYSFYIKFRYKTLSNCINFTLMNRWAKKTQLISRFMCEKESSSDSWEELYITFKCDYDYFDCVSVGAGHFLGSNAYIAVSDMELREEFGKRRLLMLV